MPSANDEESHVPTAKQINRVFGTTDDVDDAEGEQLEEIDFSEVGRLQAEVDAAAASMPETTRKAEVSVVEESFTGFYIDTNPSPVHTTSARETRPALGEEEDEDEEIIVYVAPHPRAGPITPPPQPIAVETLFAASILTGTTPPSLLNKSVERAEAGVSLSGSHDSSMGEEVLEVPQSEDPGGGIDQERVPDVLAAVEDISMAEQAIELAPEPHRTEARIDSASVQQAPEPPASTISATRPIQESPVLEYVDAVAPLEREKPVEAAPSQPAEAAQPITVEDVTFSFTETTAQRKTLTRRLHPVKTPRSLLKKSRGRRKPLRGFSSFGASLAEAQLRGVDPRVSERRLGDSDLDWGDDSDVEELSTGVGDMTVDGDLDAAAMASFVKSMSAESSRMVTMDDIADTERMRQEDEEEEDDTDDEGASSEEDSSEEDSELEAVLRKKEELFIAEGADEAEEVEEDEDDSSEEDVDDGSGSRFQARLQHMRERARNQGKGKAPAVEDSDDDVDNPILEQSKAGDYEDFISHIQVYKYAFTAD